MTAHASPPRVERADAPNDLRPDRGRRAPLDDIDRRLLALLSARPEVAVTQTSLIFEHMTPGGTTRS